MGRAARHQVEPVDDDQCEGVNIAGLCRYIDRSRHSLIKTPRALDCAAAMQRCRQHNVSCLLQLPQCLDAARPLRAMTGIDETEMPADQIRK